MSEPLNEAELITLLKRVDLTLTGEEREWLLKVYEGFRPQLRALHALDLGDEEVESAFMPLPK